jgi:hypothetical protein
MLAHTRILVTIETDPTRYHGEHAHPPGMPDASGCEQVLAHLATDLARLFTDIEQCTLTMPGALYDQTQVIRPGFPLLQSLENFAASSRRDSPNQPTRRVLSQSGGRMPDDCMQPDPSIPPGLLQNLPLLISGQPEIIGPLSAEMEHLFLEQGQLSAHSAKGLESHFGIAVTHARFMTVTDLMAMLRLQLEHFGFLPLWDLLDAALEESSAPVQANGQLGQTFEYRNDAVHCQFETFDYWALQGGGKGLSISEQDLEQAYADWTREYRQYTTTLAAHAVPVIQHMPPPHDDWLEAGFLVEAAVKPPPSDAAEVTEHSASDLGVLAVTVVRDGRQFNYYPLSPTGLNELHAEIRSLGLGPGGFSYPGRVLYDPDARCLLPDVEASAHA